MLCVLICYGRVTISQHKPILSHNVIKYTIEESIKLRENQAISAYMNWGKRRLYRTPGLKENGYCPF
jgi:hypothetical protein